MLWAGHWVHRVVQIEDAASESKKHIFYLIGNWTKKTTTQTLILMIGKMLNINLIIGQADNLSVTNFPLNTQLCLYALIITNKSYTRHALIICVLIHAYKWFYAFYRLNLLWTFRVRLTIFASRWMMSWEMEESWKRWSNLEMACLYPTVLQYWVLQFCSKISWCSCYLPNDFCFTRTSPFSLSSTSALLWFPGIFRRAFWN